MSQTGITSRLAAAAAAVLFVGLVAGCGSKPQQAVGVSNGPVVHYLLCEGDAVRHVRVTTATGRVVWQARFPDGTTRTAFRVPVPLPAGEPIRVSDPDGQPAMELTTADIPPTGILRGDGRHVTAAEFAAGRSGYCGAARRDRAAALAVGFAFVVLGLVFAQRWLRAKRTRDPFDRPYR